MTLAMQYENSRTSHRRCSIKKAVLKNVEIFTVKQLCSSLRDTQAQVFSCQYCDIFKNTYFGEHLRTAALVIQSRHPDVFIKKVVGLVFDLFYDICVITITTTLITFFMITIFSNPFKSNVPLSYRIFKTSIKKVLLT